MLGRAGLAQCHTHRARGQRGHRQSQLALGTARGVGLEVQQGQGRGLVLGLVTGLGRLCLGDWGL